MCIRDSAQALLGNPSFLIFDEPTVGLDPEERIHIRNLFSRMAQDRLVLLSTHIIEDVQSVCSRLAVIHHGSIVFAGSPAELIQSAAGHVGIVREQDAAGEQGPVSYTHLASATDWMFLMKHLTSYL